MTENQESEINAPVSDLIQSQPNVSSSNAVTGSVQTYQNNLVDNIVDINEASIISVKAEFENSESTDKRAASCNVYSENGQKRQAENKLEDEAPSCSKTAKSDCSSGTDQREEIVKEKSDDTGVKVEETGSDSDGQNMFGCELKCSICTEIFHQPVSLQVGISLRGKTLHWIGAQFCVYVFLDSIDKSLNMLKFCRNDQRK